VPTCLCFARGQLDVTAADVLTTIDEFDRLGRTEFLTKCHYGESRSYFLIHGGRFYDSKAIVGVAHQVRHGQPLTPRDFSGGDATVAALLRRLGFVVSEPNPPWTWDEIVLACDLVRQHDWRAFDDTDPAVIELSDLLRQLPIHPPELRGPTFRNPNGVARKTVDIATQHPDYPGVATHGNRKDAAVLQEFLADSDRMAAIAAALRSIANSGTYTQVPDLDLDDATANEGGLLERRHLARERNPTLRRKKIAEPVEGRAVSLVKSAASTLSTPTANGAPTSSSAIIALLSTSREPPRQTSPTSRYFAQTATA
jgi:5-methylcytosine-specific restriction protein A